MEAHHLIPLQFQDEFEYSLDVPENIISLCPNCHRAFHKAGIGVKNGFAIEFLLKREDKLLSRGIDVDIRRLMDFYQILDESDE